MRLGVVGKGIGDSPSLLNPNCKQHKKELKTTLYQNRLWYTREKSVY
jgi:hypothetical protein